MRRLLLATMALLAPLGLAAIDPEIRTSGRAEGTVLIEVQPSDSASVAARRGWASSRRRFEGDLQAWGTGVVLRSGIKRPGGHLAMEIIVGTLHGSAGRFTIRYPLDVQGSEPVQRGVIVEGSGSGALEGIRGDIRIIPDSANLRYVFTYTLP